MTWNYRVLDRDGYLAIYEVYYDDEGNVRGYTENPTYPRGYEGDLDELKTQLELYCEALDKPILKYE